MFRSHVNFFPLTSLSTKNSIFSNLLIRQYNEMDLAAMIRIWNEVVEDGVTFPQEDLLTPENGKITLA